MFSARGCVPNILPRECTRKYSPQRRISLYTPQGTGTVLDIMISVDHILHSLIISREVLILTLSIFNALKVCISWYSLATGLISEAMTYKDHIIQYSPCALGSVRRNTSLGTVFPRTLPRESIGNTSSRGNIDNAPAMK